MRSSYRLLRREWCRGAEKVMYPYCIGVNVHMSNTLEAFLRRVWSWTQDWDFGDAGLKGPVVEGPYGEIGFAGF